MKMYNLKPKHLKVTLYISEALGHRNKLVRAIRSLTVCDFSNRGSTSSKDAMGEKLSQTRIDHHSLDINATCSYSLINQLYNR